MTFITIDAVTEDGVQHEVLVRASEAPRIGDEFVEDGIRMQRVPSIPMPPRVKKYEFVGYSLPNRKHAAAQGRTMAPRYDSRGRPVFESRREVQEYAARVNDNPNEGYKLEWDPDGGLADE